jgi:hypothetical protein
MSTKSAAAALLLLLTLSLAAGLGCSFSAGQLQLVSTKPTGVKAASLDKKATGRDCIHHTLLLVPLGRSTPSYEVAVANALAEAPSGSLLTDVQVETRGWTAILFGRTCLEVAGDVWLAP